MELHGDINISNINEVRDSMRKELKDLHDDSFVIGLSGIESCDITFFQLLFSLMKECKKKGQQLVLKGECECFDGLLSDLELEDQKIFNRE